jgi:hydrogenase maturation protease
VRVLIGGVGYRNLRDHSAGPAVVDRLCERPWPADVVIEDLSYNPIAVVQRLQDEPAERRFEHVVLVGAVVRGRRPGRVTAYRWDGRLPPDEEVQRAVTEAVTGVIALENTVVVAGHLGALPADVVVVEIEPAAHEFGETFTAAVAAGIGRACRLVTRLALSPEAVVALPRAPLVGRPATTEAR